MSAGAPCPAAALQVICPECMREGSRALQRAIDDQGHPEALPAPRISVRGLVRHAARIAGVPVDQVIAGPRTQRLVRLRHAVVLVATEYPIHLTTIARALGRRDHSTMINGRERGRALVERDPEFAWFVERLRAAGECAPLGPDGADEPEPEPEPPAEQAVPWPEIEGATEGERVRPLPPPQARVQPGEYVPRHALPPVMAVVDLDREGPVAEPNDSGDGWQSMMAGGSAALLSAMQREGLAA